MTYSKLVRQKHLRKALLLVLLSVSDYKPLDTTLYFIITNLHKELKPQANASHDMNSPAFTMLYAHRLELKRLPRKFFGSPLEKRVGHILKLLDIV